MRLTRAQVSALERIARTRTNDASPETVAAEAAEALRSVVGWDGFRTFSIDPETLQIGRLLAASEHDAAQRQRWLRGGYQAEERVPFGSFGMEARMRMNVRAITFHEDLDKSFGMPAEIRKTFDQRAYLHSHHTHVVEYHPGVTIDGNLLMNFPDGSRWVATMQAYRIGGKRAFRATDVAFAQYVAPRIGEAIGAALLREQMQPEAADAPASGASGVIVLGRTGEIQYASPAGREWLEALRRHPLEHQTVLPTAVLSSIAGLRSGRESAIGRIGLPGTVATIEATPGGSDGSIALVVSASRPAGAPTLPVAWELTPAESRVAALVIEGHGNRDVADTLSISEHTVEWHLRRIFDKLGVKSRSQLTALNLSGAVLTN